jgi:hypothetical protein
MLSKFIGIPVADLLDDVSLQMYKVNQDGLQIYLDSIYKKTNGDKLLKENELKLLCLSIV